MHDATTMPAFSTTAPTKKRIPLGVFAGWFGIAAVIGWLVIAGLGSSTDVHAVVGPVPFFFVAIGIIAAVVRARVALDDDDDAPVARWFGLAGLVLLSAWLTTSFTAAFSMNWGADPWLLQIVETFHHRDKAQAWAVAVVVIAGVAAVAGTKKELVLLVAMACVSALLTYGLLPFALAWIAGRWCARRASWRWVRAVVIVTAVGIAFDVSLHDAGYGPFYGSWVGLLAVFGPFMAPVAVACAVVGWRRREMGVCWLAVAVALLPIVFIQPHSLIGAPLLLLLVGPPTRATFVAMVAMLVGGVFVVRHECEPAWVAGEVVLTAMAIAIGTLHREKTPTSACSEVVS